MDQYTYERYERKALTYFEQQRFDKALKYFNRIEDINYNEKAFWSLKGHCYNSLGDFKSAMECYERTLNIDPMDSQAWVNKGQALSCLGSFKGTIKCCDKALEYDPTNVGALNIKGLALEAIGKHKEAIESFDEALDLEPLNEAIKENKQRAMNAIENDDMNAEPLTRDSSCPICGFDNIKNSSFCQSCGNDLNQEINIDLNCSDCGFENKDGAKFCSGCGKKLGEEKEDNICSSCGSTNKLDSKFCMKCGEDLRDSSKIDSIQTVDVNKDSEEKIASLPGIGAILAKKAIKIRESTGGFVSADDFCSSLELKPHIAENIKSLIICTSKKPKDDENSRRIVDF